MHLIYHVDMLKKQVSCSTLREITKEYIPSEENEKNNGTKEDKVDEKEDTWRMVTNYKQDSNEIVNDRSTYEVMIINATEHDDCEEYDDRYW